MNENLKTIMGTRLKSTRSSWQSILTNSTRQFFDIFLFWRPTYSWNLCLSPDKMYIRYTWLPMCRMTGNYTKQDYKTTSLQGNNILHKANSKEMQSFLDSLALSSLTRNFVSITGSPLIAISNEESFLKKNHRYTHCT